MIAIAGVGLCTAQGTAREILAGGALAAPLPLPWPRAPRATCGIGFAARGIAAGLRGAARWHALASAALADLGGAPAPVIAASCNGAADAASADDWAHAFAALGGPVASAACASGIHALWLGATRLAAGVDDEVIVLASDILSAVNHDQFESLRVLSETPAPWQATATGFLPGEAAVAIRLVRGGGLALGGPLLAHDRDGVDALAALVAAMPWGATHAIGQGTGPVAIDDRELAALPRDLPLATPLAAFGHALGASGLLSVALAALGRDRALAALAMNALGELGGPNTTRDDLAVSTNTEHPGREGGAARDIGASHAGHAADGLGTALVASDGRALGTALGDALVACRALGGACAAVGVGVPAALVRSPPPWSAPAEPPALRIPMLRRIASEARAHRPALPPGAQLVRLDAPIVPPADARIGGRRLPSVVLEMTPGFTAQLVARAWGYGGPALCLVGGSEVEWQTTLAACRRVHGATLVLHVGADGLEWDE